MKGAFTIVTTNYISYAKTLGDSIVQHNPDYVFFICLIGKKEDLNNDVDVRKFDLIEMIELNDQEVINLMQSKYSPFELSCALKPYFAEHILKNRPVTRLKYLDGDIMFFDSFDQDIEANTTSSIFLTPHFFNSVDLSEDVNDASLIKGGIYNAGYFEVTNTNISYSFLDWWKSRLAKCCYYYKPPYEQIFVDQSWLNLVPVYFKDTYIIDHLGYNTSFYNLHERKISNINGNYLINDSQRLIFFHFTGYKYYQHEQVSIHFKKYNYKNTPYLESICNLYRQTLLKNSIKSTFQAVNDETKPPFTLIFSKFVNHILGKCLKLKIVKI
jgi:hypothetical protein